MIIAADYAPTRSTAGSTAERPESRLLPARRLVVLAPMYLFLIVGWFRAGVEKVIDPTWWTGDGLVAFLDEQRDAMLPFFVPFADSVVDPIAPVVAWLVMCAQFAIAMCLATNRRVRTALWAGIVLNLSFTMAGRVNPSAFYLVMQMTLLFALSRPTTLRIATRRATLLLIPALLVAPFARTLDPHHVIEDPALMLSFMSLLAAVTTIASAGPSTELVEAFGSTRIGRAIERPHVLRHRLKI